MIRVHGAIGEDVNAGSVRQQLAAWPIGRPVVVSINSEGGLVGEANRIRMLLDERRPWTAIARRAESAALFIFASADRRLLFSDSILLAHPVRYRGERDEETRRMERHNALTLSCSSGGLLTFEEAVQMQQTEWRFSAAEALALGLADDII